MNKPHYLFHLGDRSQVSTNFGWGYWADGHPLRIKYANTKDNMYAAMTIHDGETMFEEVVNDTRPKINTRIRYQLRENYWEAEIEMENKEAEEVVWFTYASVENNDYRKVDHEKHTSFIQISPEYEDEKERDEVRLRCLSLMVENQTVRVRQQKSRGNE
jgi:hypothetical protein